MNGAGDRRPSALSSRKARGHGSSSAISTDSTVTDPDAVNRNTWPLRYGTKRRRLRRFRFHGWSSWAVTGRASMSAGEASTLPEQALLEGDFDRSPPRDRLAHRPDDRLRLLFERLGESQTQALVRLGLRLGQRSPGNATGAPQAV